MFKVDFLILFEHRERELENACLIKTCLNRKGYSVIIRPIYSFNQFLYDPKVMIVPHLYNDEQVKMFISKYRLRRCKVINMQYEQVLSIDPKNSLYSIPSGTANRSILFAWGEAEASRYIEKPDQLVEKTGCISMDFNSKCFDSYFMSKEELRHEFKLKRNKWFVFMSSFSLANCSDEKLKQSYPNNYEQMKIFSEVSSSSKKEVLNWFTKYIEANPEVDIIYRPHPSEEVDAFLEDIEKRYDQFHIIRKYSIRQWIRVADLLINWFSTSAVDAYYAGKKCMLVRPYKIPENLDISFFSKAEHIESFAEFAQHIYDEKGTDYDYSQLTKYYGDRRNTLAINTFVDKCDQILIDDEKYKSHLWNINHSTSFIGFFRSLIRDLLYDLNSLFRLNGLYKILFCANRKLYEKSIYIQREVYKYQKLQREYENRLSGIEIKI